MTSWAVSPRQFIPGTTGWSARDLDNPEIERQWFAGRYEIVEGVLTAMAPAFFKGGNALFNILFALKAHLRDKQITGKIGTEVDIVLDESRIVIADAVFMSPEDEARQSAAAGATTRAEPSRVRVLTPPTLVIESISPGHEIHDTRIKKRWYADFGVRNYWIVDAFGPLLQCLVLDGGNYRVDAEGGEIGVLSPSLFPGFNLDLSIVWND